MPVAALNKLIAEVKDGKKTYEQGLAEVMKLLGSIDASLKAIIAQLDEYRGILEKLVKKGKYRYGS